MSDFPDPAIQSRIGAAARLQFVGAVLRSILLFGYQWIVARAYGTGPFGIMNLALSGYQTATALGRGAGDNVVLRGQRSSDRRSAFSAGVTLSLCAGTIAACGLAVSGILLSKGRAADPVAIAFLLVSVAVPAAAVLFPLGAGLQRDHRFLAYTTIVTLLDPFARVLFLAGVVLLGFHWLGSIAAITVSACCAAIAAAFLLRRELRVPPALQLRDGILPLLRYSGTTTLASALVHTGVLFIQLTILTLLGRGADTGVFAAASRLALLALWVQGAFSAPFLPLVARQLSDKDAEIDLDAIYGRVVSGVLWINGPFLVGLIVAAPAVLGLFGPSFSTGAMTLALLAVGQWANSATALAEDFLPLGNRAGLGLLNNLGAVVMVAVLGIPLAARFGVVGLAWASSGAIVLVNVVRSVQVRRLFAVALPMRTVLVAGAASAVVVLLLVRFTWARGDHPLLQLVFGGVAALLTAGSMWLFGSRADRLALVTLVRGTLKPST